MADHPLTLKLFYSGVYNDVSTDVSQNDPVVIQHGGAEISDAPRPSTASFTFEDRSGKYRPYLPTSALYGIAGRNTPVQVTAGGFFEVASWDPDQTLGFNQAAGRGRRSTKVQAAGPLLRVGGWTEPIESAMTRKLKSLGNVYDLWTLEDSRDADQLGNAYGEGVRDGSYLNGSYVNNGLGDQESPGGGSTSFKMSGYSHPGGSFDPNGPKDAWQVAFAFKLPTVLPSSTYQGLFELIVGANSNLGQSWIILVNDTRYRIQIYDAGGSTLIVDTTVAYGADTPNQWIMMRLQGSTSGGVMSWGIGWMTETNGVAVGTSGSVAAVGFSNPISWDVQSSPGTPPDGANFAYVCAGSGLLPDLIGAASTGPAFGGYRGETTGDRFLRLCGEEFLAATVEGTSDEAMGPQRPDTLIKLLREIRDTDGGMLVDNRLTTLGLWLRSRKSMYAQAPALALTFGVNVGPPLKPAFDNLNAHNVITVNNRGGGTSRVVDSTSLMGTAAPPNGINVAKQDIDVNVLNNSRLTDIANWWLGIGTLPDVRYPLVTVDLDANPGLEATAVAIRAGARLTIASLDPDVIDLLVIGTLDVRDNQKRRKIAYTCVPYRAYDIAQYQTDGATPTAAMKRYESRTSTTNTALSTTVTTIVVTFTDIRDAWSQTSAPYDWVIAGERITVTAMGAVTGSGPWAQSATVTRSLNGVPKAHAAGEPVHMHPDQQARYAL